MKNQKNWFYFLFHILASNCSISKCLIALELRLYSNCIDDENSAKNAIKIVPSRSGTTSTAIFTTSRFVYSLFKKLYTQNLINYNSVFFLLNSEMVKGRGKNARQTRNLLLKMASDKLEGPISILKEWKDQRKRVKVREQTKTINEILFYCAAVSTVHLSVGHIRFVLLFSPSLI